MRVLSVEEARDIVRATARPLMATEVILAEEATGRVMARTVESDIDVPPYRKALMDGYAVSAQSVHGKPELEVAGELTAGMVSPEPLAKGCAVRIMTGTPLPEGADAVIVQEVTEPIDGGRRIRVSDTSVEPMQNVLERAYVTACGEAVLEQGVLIRPHHVGLLSEVGAARIRVFKNPSVAVVPTGDELVPATDFPGSGQIRNSNGPMLKALATSAGAEAHQSPAISDDLPRLREALASALEHDVVLLSGGVSVGVRDFVPRVLEELGVDCDFHRVAFKPGKPIWFGHRDHNDRRCLVFGLPGNPVSNLVGFELFARGALEQLGHRPERLRVEHLRVKRPFHHRSARRTFHPARRVDGGVELLPWKGSADQRVLAKADALCDLRPGPYTIGAGERLAVIPLQEVL